jgi:hypothetical protein
MIRRRLSDVLYAFETVSGRGGRPNRGIGNAEVEGMGMLPLIAIVNQINARGYCGNRPVSAV